MIPEDTEIDNIDVWWEDESRVGQKGTLSRIWAKKGERPRVVKQQQYLNTYIIGSVCPAQNCAEAIISPECTTDVMQQHLHQISKATLPGRLALVIMDRAGWHTTDKLNIPSNVAILFLPPYSPELNPMEQVWQWIKNHFLSNRVFKNYDDIEKSCCRAWNFFAQSQNLFESICCPEWIKRNV